MPNRLLAQATDVVEGLRRTGQSAGFRPEGPADEIDYLEFFVGNVVNALLGVLGIVFVVLIVYGGTLYMTAGGNEERVDKAKKLLVNAVIGLVIILLSYALVNFVIGGLLATGEDRIPPPTTEECLQNPQLPGCPEGI